MKKLPILILLLAALPAVSIADQSRKIQFRTLCIEQITGLEYLVIPASKDPAENQEVVLYKDMSPVIEGVFKTGEAIFYTMKPGPGGKLQRVVAGKAPLGKSKRQLFVFFPGSGEDGQIAYQVKAYDDELRDFPLGNVRTINAATVPIRVNIPGAAIPPVPPDTFVQFPHSKVVDEYNLYPVSVEFQGNGEEWVKGLSVNWKADDRRREIVIALEDRKTKNHTVQMFSDFPSWVPAVK